MFVDDPLVEDLIIRASRSFEIFDVEWDGSVLTLDVVPYYSHRESFSMLLKDFEGTGFLPYYRRRENGYVLLISRRVERRKEISRKMHMVLMVATIVTMTMAGYIWWAGGDVFLSVVFAISLMGILGLHELGHALTARRKGIDATLPYFIPVPPPFPFGTFGAVISINSPVIDRRSLLEIGVSGPIAGFIVAIPILMAGLKYSTIAPLDEAQVGGLMFSMPLLLHGLTALILGDIPANHIIIPHPLAIAGWAGLFVTSLNLLPMGQLDGGHIVRGLFPNYYKEIYYGVAVVLLFLGLLWPGYIVWVFLAVFIMKMDHPGPLDDVSELEFKHKIYALAALLVLILSFMPVPIVSP
jgi:Zn-dependent protease